MLLIILAIVICVIILVLFPLEMNGYQPKPKYSKMSTCKYVDELKSEAPRKFKIKINR